MIYHSRDRCLVMFVELICYQRDKGRVAMTVTSFSVVVPFGPNIWHCGVMLRVSSKMRLDRHPGERSAFFLSV